MIFLDLFFKIIFQIFLTIFLQKFFCKIIFNDLHKTFKYICSAEPALNKMEQCPLCCEFQPSNQALAIHLKKIHPQRNTAIQIMQ